MIVFDLWHTYLPKPVTDCCNGLISYFQTPFIGTYFLHPVIAVFDRFLTTLHPVRYYSLLGVLYRKFAPFLR